MKTAILTYSKESNCGAVLQAWALKKVIERFGCSVDMPTIRGFATRGRWYSISQARKRGVIGFFRNLIYQILTLGMRDLIDYRFRKATAEMFPTSVITVDSLRMYDFLVVGSDQVWNPSMGIYKLPLYLGEVVPRGVPLIAYAVSVGDCVPDKALDGRFANAVRRFSHIFAREKSTEMLIKRASGVVCRQAIDPSLLLPIECYSELEEGIVPREPYVFFYVISADKVAKFVPKILASLRIAHAVFFDGCIDVIPRRRPAGYRRFLSPGQFVKLSRHAAAIVACSFHGTAFAVLSKKPFISITTRPISEKHDTRQGSLLQKIGCQDRMFSIDENVEDMCRVLRTPLATSVEKSLNDYRQSSLTMLRNAIDEVRTIGR